jgi:hypothetical protein
MPITPYLNGVRFDPETKRVVGVAFERVCLALRIEGSDDHVKQAIATKIIDLAKAGERNPDLLCERVLEEIRGPQGAQKEAPVRPGPTESIEGR